MRRLVLSTVILCVWWGTSLRAQAPGGEDWVLAHIDVETTGFVPGYHEIVDIGVVYTEKDGTILARWHRRVMPRHPERAEPEAVAINGFDPEIWKERGALSPEEAVESLLGFERKRFPNRKILRVAYNSKFDAAFMDHLFRSAAESFDQPNYSYFWLDIPSMAWMLGYRQLTVAGLAEALGVQEPPPEPLEHTGLACAEFNVRVYRALLSLRTSPPRD